MKSLAGRFPFAVFVLLSTVALAFTPAQAKLIPRVDNFVILVDLSGSMFQKHAESQEVKAVLVKKVLRSMNERIPALGYTGAIQVFNPNATLIGPEEYNRFFFEREIEKFPEDGKVFGNYTPLGSEIKYLDKVMNRFSGKSAIIILSDGKVNEGMDPLKAARYIDNEYTNMCFHTISFADDTQGEETLRGISQVSNCGTYASGKELLARSAAMDEYVGDVFFLEMPDEVLVVEEVITEVIIIPPEVVLQGVYFDFDKSDIKSNYKPILTVVVDQLKGNPETRAVIEGHTDSVGPAEYNQGLSERRAGVVRDYLISQGIAEERLQAVGYGAAVPIVSNLTPEGRAMNRRTDIRVIQ
jgi:OOP family OmpA-OmpF porin